MEGRELNRDCSKERSCLPYKAEEGGLTIWCVKVAVGFSVVAVTIATITDNDVKQETEGDQRAAGDSVTRTPCT